MNRKRGFLLFAFIIFHLTLSCAKFWNEQAVRTVFEQVAQAIPNQTQLHPILFLPSAGASDFLPRSDHLTYEYALVT